jgi:RimJ/RimL family protein N-acetyltransferase
VIGYRSNQSTFRRPPLPAIVSRSSLPEPWCENLVLEDGRQLRLRPIEPEDGEPMRQSFKLLHPEEVRLRFMHPMREMSPDLIRKLTQFNRKQSFALVLAEPLPPGEALIGAVVRASLSPDGRQAEFAILVSRVLTGQGLGRFLMKKIIRWAQLKRLDAIYGNVLDENTPMLQLAESLGFHRQHLADDRGVVRVHLDLKPKPKPPSS